MISTKLSLKQAQTCRLLKKMSFQPMNFRHLELNGGYFGFLRRVHGTFFLGIVHIFLDVSAKFQHYNIFFPGSSTKLVPTTALFTRNFLILFSVLVSISIDNEMSIQKFMVKFSFLHNFSSRNSHVWYQRSINWPILQSFSTEFRDILFLPLFWGILNRAKRWKNSCGVWRVYKPSP